MARKSRGKKIAQGIFRDEYGFAVTVAIGTGKNKLQREIRYPADTKTSVMTNWQEETRVALRKLLPKDAKGTLAADVKKYLAAVRSMATFGQRESDLALWVAKFPNRARHSIKTHEISTVLQDWLAEGYAPMTVYNRRTALQAVWSTLDGERADNPVDKAFDPERPELGPKDLPLDIVERVLDALEDRGQGVRGQKRGTVSKTKIRLRLMAASGIPHKLMKQIKPAPEGIRWEAREVYLAKRRKGKGVDGRWVPLNDEAYAALVDFDTHDCYGPFSNSSMNKSFKRAWLWVHPEWPKDKPIPYPYQLRHTFATASVAEGQDDKGVAALLMHAEGSNVIARYTRGAVPERMQRAADAYTQRRLRLVKNAKTWGAGKKRKTG